MHPPRLLSYLFFILLLLFGPGAALAHELDLDAHQSGTVCQVCLHYYSVKDFLQTTSTPYTPVLLPPSRNDVSAPDTALPRPFAAHARDPPHTGV